MGAGDLQKCRFIQGMFARYRKLRSRRLKGLRRTEDPASPSIPPPAARATMGALCTHEVHFSTRSLARCCRNIRGSLYVYRGHVQRYVVLSKVLKLASAWNYLFLSPFEMSSALKGTGKQLVQSINSVCPLS